MPRSAEMTWVPGRRLWRKVYEGHTYTVSCRQLVEQGHAILSETKEGSYIAANAWWHKKRSEEDAKGRTPPCPPTPLDDVVLAEAGVSLLEKIAPKYAPELAKTLSCEQKRLLVEFLRPIVMERLLAGEPLHPATEFVIPPARILEVQDAVKGLRGEPTASLDKTVATYVEQWMTKQRTLAGAGQLAAGRVTNKGISLEHLKTFFGPQSAIEGLGDGQKLEGFYLYCLGKICPGGRATGGWSAAYAKEVFAVARSFIRWAWEQRACELPRNINAKFKFGSLAKAVTTWTVEEFRSAIKKAPGKLRLALLLMANCGMTQKDVSDLRDGEVSWKAGRITRRRSKTAAHENVPTVSYPLWPLTFKLLKKYRSRTDRVLLTESGRPFVRDDLNAAGVATRVDGFGEIFRHYRKKWSLKRSLKQLRKLAASLLSTHKDYGRFESYFLAHSPRLMADKHYVVPPQELFDEAVRWLGEQLGQVVPGNE